MKIFSDKPKIDDNQIKFYVESQESFDVYEVVVKLKATPVFRAIVKLYFCSAWSKAKSQRPTQRFGPKCNTKFTLNHPPPPHKLFS